VAVGKTLAAAWSKRRCNEMQKRDGACPVFTDSLVRVNSSQIGSRKRVFSTSRDPSAAHKKQPAFRKRWGPGRHNNAAIYGMKTAIISRRLSTRWTSTDVQTDTPVAKNVLVPIAHSIKQVSPWMAATGCMLLIFVGSTDVLCAAHTSRFLVPFLVWLGPQISLPTIAAIHFELRKVGHLTEYAILAALLWCALRSTLAVIRTFVITDLVFFASVAIAAADEFHQSFVPSRTASIKDVIIDTCGAAIALALCVASRRRAQGTPLIPNSPARFEPEFQPRPFLSRHAILK